jgi:hypothetical protein
MSDSAETNGTEALETVWEKPGGGAKDHGQPPRGLELVPDSMETNEDDFVEIAADATEASARPCGKPGRSGPPGNRNARARCGRRDPTNARVLQPEALRSGAWFRRS